MINVRAIICAIVVAATVFFGAASADAAGDVEVVAVPTSGYIPDSMTKTADGAIWFSAEFIQPCHGNVSCQTEELDSFVASGIQERSLGRISTVGAFDGILAGPDSTIWATDALASARIFDLSGRQIAFLKLGGANGDALSAPFVGPDGRVWFAGGSPGTGGGGVVAVDAKYHIALVAACPQCFFFGGVTAADGNAWLLDPYLGGFYRVTPQGVLTRFDFGKAVLTTLTAGPAGWLWGSLQGNIGAYNTAGKRVATFTPQVAVQSGLQRIGADVVWANYGPSKSGGDELDVTTLAPSGATSTQHYEQIGACPPSDAQWFSAAPVLGGDGALYVGVGCSAQQPPYTVGGLGYVVRIGGFASNQPAFTR